MTQVIQMGRLQLLSPVTGRVVQHPAYREYVACDGDDENNININEHSSIGLFRCILATAGGNSYMYI